MNKGNLVHEIKLHFVLLFLKGATIFLYQRHFFLIQIKQKFSNNQMTKGDGNLRNIPSSRRLMITLQKFVILYAISIARKIEF